MTSSTIALDARLLGKRGGGDSTYWTGLLHGLCQIEHDAHFLLISNTPMPRNIPMSDRFHWITLPSRNERWWSIVKFPLMARKLGAHAIHTQYNVSPLAGKRSVTTVHDVSFFVNPEWFQPKDRFMLQKFVPASVRKAKKVITVSEASRIDLLRFIPESAGKTVVTPNACGISITPMERAPAQAMVLDKLGVASPYILTVGTRSPRKNMNLVIAACEMLEDQLSHTLVVTGKEGWGEEKPGRRVVTSGYVDDLQLSALYCGADLYLAPSLYEGFGIPLLEAFTCRCPVLCSDGGAQPEVAGQAACILRGSNAHEWSATIGKLLHDSSKLQTMRNLGHQRAGEFSWKRTAELTLEVYREVLA